MGYDEALVGSTSAILGDKVSEYLNNISVGLRGITAPQIDMLEGRLYSAVDNFLEEYDLVSTEQVVYCDELHYAGRYDGIIKCRVSGEELLVDWKTYGAWQDKPYKRVSSKLKKAKEQLTMYAYAMNWEKEMGVVIFKNDGTWEIEKVVFEKGILKWVRDNQDLILEVIEDEKKETTY